MDRILVIRTDNMGDVLLSTAVLPLLRSRFPRARISMLVNQYAAELLANNPYLDEVLILEGSNMALLSRLRQGKYDWAIFLLPRPRLALLAWLAGIAHRVGTSRRFYSFLFNHRVRISRRRMAKHELEYNLDLLGPLGIVSPKRAKPVFRLTKDEESWAGTYLKKQGVKSGERLVMLHPGGFGSALLWPAGHYVQLIDRLAKLKGIRLILGGGSGERRLLAGIARACVSKPLVLGGKLSLRQYAALIDRAGLFVSASTGPMHLASCLATRLVALFCPIRDCTPERWGPYTRRATVLMPPLAECEECKEENCAHAPCMDKLSVDTVFAACQKELVRATRKTKRGAARKK
jgi:ADP-heptose:LPS heptosyltransferase